MARTTCVVTLGHTLLRPVVGAISCWRVVTMMHRKDGGGASRPYGRIMRDSHRSILITGAGGLVAITLAACSAASTPAPDATSSATSPAAQVAVPASSDCAGAAAAPGAQTVATTDYYMVMGVGGPEQMYTKAQMQSMHPTSGELMVAGTMMGASPSAQASGGSGSQDMPGMGGSADPSTRHVEVMICDQQTGKVITGSMPSMTMGAMNAAADTIPVAEMQGVDEGPGDTHYGNNVPMTTGDEYTITCTLNGQTATFTVKTPA